MKNLKFLLALFIFISLVSSCDQEEINPNPGTDPGSAVFPTTDVNVVVPNGTSIDLSKTKVLSGFAEYPVDNAGKSKVQFPSGGRKLAFLVDSEGNTIMMGFITDKKKEISLSTTASVLVYFGLGISLQPIEIKNRYLEEYSSMDGMPEFTQSILEEFSKNPEMVRNGGFLNSLTDYLSTFASADTIDIRAKQIDVDIDGFKSGLQVYELDHQNIQIRNERRRRAHAFTYKTAFKDKEGVQTTLKYKIEGGDVAENDLAVNPRLAITSVTGVLKDIVVQKVLEKESEFPMTENGPINLPLKDSESEATYKVRVVGPGRGNLGGLDLTTAEKEKLDRLVLETFALDFLVPFIYDVIGMDDAVFGTQSDGFKDLLWTIEVFVKASPVVEKFLLEGDYMNAFRETILMGLQEYPSKVFEDTFKELVDEGYKILKAKKPGSVTETAKKTAEKAKSVLKALKVADYILKAVDYKFMLDHIQMSEYIAEFTATVKADDLVMSPKEETIIPFAYYNIKVDTKTTLAEGESFVFKWSTPGKFIYLWHQSKKSLELETSVANIAYRSDTKAADLSDENNIDIIKVEVFTKKGTTLTRIGDAEATINVKKLRLVMKPNNITLSGGQNVALYIERTDGVNDIVSNSALDYKVEWETSGTYGKFNGTLKSATTMGNKINYEVLDKDVKEAKESFLARVYFKAKADTEWVLRESVKGELNINNDPNKIILDVALETVDWILDNRNTTGGYSAGINRIVRVPIHPKAKKYIVKTYGFKIPLPGWENKGVSWLPGKTPPSVYGFPGAGPNEIVGGDYYYTIGRTWCAGNPPGCGADIGVWTAHSNSYGGRANIIIEIED